MRLRLMQFTVKRVMGFVAIVGLLLAGEHLQSRSTFYRKQAALCAYFELQCRWYAATDTDEDSWKGLTIEEKRENARLNLIESQRFGALKNAYRRVARNPWEPLPPNAPTSVNGWDLGALPASEIEEMVREWNNH